MLNAVTGSTIGAPGVQVPIGAVDIAILNVDRRRGLDHRQPRVRPRLAACCATPSRRAACRLGAARTSRTCRPTSTSPATPALNPRFTNTLDGGTGALVPEASTLKGRIAPSAIVTEGGEKIGIVGATTQLLEAISSPTGTEVQGLPDRAPGANGEVDDMVLLARSCSRSSTS